MHLYIMYVHTYLFFNWLSFIEWINIWDKIHSVSVSKLIILSLFPLSYICTKEGKRKGKTFERPIEMKQRNHNFYCDKLFLSEKLLEQRTSGILTNI